VQADIELHLQEELGIIMSPSRDEVVQLVELAGNLLIYTATAVRYINPGNTAADHSKRIATALAADAKPQKVFTQIDMLYSAILIAAFDDAYLQPEEIDCLRLVLRTVVYAREPIPVKTLVVLAGLKDDYAEATLQPLRSVSHVSE
jgi:hypothetical protein